MDSFLILATWMGFGILGAMRFGPAGSWPVAMVFGPLWLPIAAELRATPASTEQQSAERLRKLGFVQEGDR